MASTLPENSGAAAHRFEPSPTDSAGLFAPQSGKAAQIFFSTYCDSPIKVFATLAVIAFLLRIFYAGHLYQDDGLWFTAAEEILRGKALYREIYFDKPPVLPLLYALLFKLFGDHILTIRLFTIFYSLAVAFVLYLFASFLYNKRAGLLAAAMFVIFSTTYLTGHFQGLNTDFLMTLPYTLGAYWFVRAQGAFNKNDSAALYGRSSLTAPDSNPLESQAGATTEGRPYKASDYFFHKQRWLISYRARRAWFALAAGIASGIAFQTNPKALFNLLFFVLCLLFLLRVQDEVNKEKLNPQSAIRNPQSKLPTAYCLLLTAAGFILGAMPFWIYIAATNSLTDYRFYVWEWGTKYAVYFSLKDTLQAALSQSAGYFALNNTLLFGLMFVVAATVMRMIKPGANRREALKSATGADSVPQTIFRADATLLIWFVTSYAAMSVGGRFFGHYFFQILPSLCLLAARGISGIIKTLASQRNEKPLLRRLILAFLLAGFVLTLVRFHTRTAVLAWDWARGAKSEMTKNWNHEKLNREERLLGGAVKDLPDDFAEIERLGIEGLRGKAPQQRSEKGGDNYLFIWGYRPEIYYWAGMMPASRFLSTQPLTGVPSDVHYFGEAYISVLDEKTTAAYRQQLLSDLQATRPIYIIDELGFFNNDLAMKNYPELKDFLAEYKFAESRGRSLIYYRPKTKEKNKESSSD